jgi:hypothetical protein
MAQNQSVINNLSNTPKLRREALNQNRIWEQMFKKDSANINNPTAQVIRSPFTWSGGAAGPNTVTTTQSITETETYDVSHFLELGAGLSFVLKVGGSGVDGGYEFKTKKTMGTSISGSSSSSTSVSYTLQDNDDGDIFRTKIIKDKTYVTPIFLLDSAQSKTSCPYEGGNQRDLPLLKINNSNQNSVSVQNITLGTAGTFQVNICHSSTEPLITDEIEFLRVQW